MNNFINGLLQDSKKFWIYAIFVSLWVVSLLDLLSGAFNGNFFKFTLVVSITALISYFLYLALSDKKQTFISSKMKQFEENRSREFFTRINSDPEFNTFCYQCDFYNHELRGCQLNFSYKFSPKNIRAKNIDYCLYWSNNPEMVFQIKGLFSMVSLKKEQNR